MKKREDNYLNTTHQTQLQFRIIGSNSFLGRGGSNLCTYMDGQRAWVLCKKMRIQTGVLTSKKQTLKDLQMFYSMQKSKADSEGKNNEGLSNEE